MEDAHAGQLGVGCDPAEDPDKQCDHPGIVVTRQDIVPVCGRWLSRRDIVPVVEVWFRRDIVPVIGGCWRG